MKIIPVLTFVVDLIMNIWLLLVVLRRDIWKQLPYFTLYIASEFVATCVGLTLWFIDKKLYVNVFWWMEGIRIILLISAVRESFVRTFVGFRSLRWFPWAVGTVIASVILYSTWKAIYAPPVQSNRLISFIIAGEFTFRWGFVAVGLLSLVLVKLLELPTYTREMSVLVGCTIASTAFLVNVVSRSFFGTRFVSITQFAPDVGYLIAVGIWIKYMLRSDEDFGFRELGVTPEGMALELRRYREIVEGILRRS